MAVSDSIDSAFAAHTEVSSGTLLTRSNAQLLLMLVFMAIGLFLMAVTALFVSRLRSLKFDSARASQAKDSH